MALEEALTALTAALNANTAALGSKAAPAGKPAGKPAADTKITAAQIKAAVIAVKDAFDKPTALALIKKHAKVTEIAQIKPSFYQSVMDACEAKMAEQESTEDDPDADDDNEL